MERVPLKGVRGIIAERMAASVHTTARVTLLMEVDATELVNMRERLKARVEKEWGFAPGYNDLLAKIVAMALRQYPYMNARRTGEAIERLAQINLGMAVDTERGLLVPVIRDADKKNLREFGTEFRERVERARTGRSLPDDLTGGTFTVTNLGMYDVMAFTPVINLPEAAILGVGNITPQPVARGDQVVIRKIMYLSAGGRTCSNNTCHGATTPEWGVGTVTCASCHGNSTNGTSWPDGAAHPDRAGAHSQHIDAIYAVNSASLPGATVNEKKNATCDWCHPNPGGVRTGTAEAGHKDDVAPTSQVDVAEDGRVGSDPARFYNNAPLASRVADPNGTYTNTAGIKTCYNVDCHGGSPTPNWETGPSLERGSQRNVELMWLLTRFMPDFKTIADFRKDQGSAIRRVCRELSCCAGGSTCSPTPSSPSTAASSRP